MYGAGTLLDKNECRIILTVVCSITFSFSEAAIVSASLFGGATRRLTGFCHDCGLPPSEALLPSLCVSDLSEEFPSIAGAQELG